MPLRFDKVALRKPERTPNGWLRGDAYLTRTGIFHYMRADGSTLRELRLPEHVFDRDSLASFSQVPVTNDHPEVELNADNTKKYAVGSIGERVERDGDFMHSRMLLWDGNAVRDVEGGKVEVSCGYTCDLDFTPGMYEGEPYDAIQTNIRGNHVAIVDRGRAGPEVRIRMDGAAIMVDKKKDQAMSDVITGGKRFAVSTDQHAAIMKIIGDASGEPVSDGKTDKAEVSRLLAENVTLKKERDGLQAKVDSVSTAATEAQKKADADKLRDSLREEVKGRLALEAKAGSIVGDAFKADGKTDKEIKCEVIKHLDASADLASKSDEYVNVFYDLVVKKADTTDATNADTRAATVGGKPGERKPDEAKPGERRGDEAGAQKDMNKANVERGVKPLSVGRTFKR